MNRYDQAILIQNAVNIVAVVNTYMDIQREVMDESGDPNTDPAVKLIEYRIRQMEGKPIDLQAWSDAYDACEEQSTVYRLNGEGYAVRKPNALTE
jgi:hypothetical protein